MSEAIHRIRSLCSVPEDVDLAEVYASYRNLTAHGVIRRPENYDVATYRILRGFVYTMNLKRANVPTDKIKDIISNLSKDQADLYYVKGWRSDSDNVPIYHADSPHAFNRAIGYARYKNSSAGTVLYRGQNKLLSRQYRSGLDANRARVLPSNTICNYHVNEMIYCSDFLNILNTRKIKSFPEDIHANNPIDLFILLMNVGWDNETCALNTSWNEQRPYVGQSASTAIWLQRCFGGDICLTNFSSKAHYFNIVNGIIVDLTRSELQNDQVKKCYDITNYTLVKRWNGNVYKKNQKQVEHLLQNCKNKKD